MVRGVIGAALWFIASAAAQSPVSGAVFRDCADCPEMVKIPPGAFVMGSPDAEADREVNEGPVRLVTIATPFALGRFEVTVGEFAAFVAAAEYVASAACPDVVAQRAGSSAPPSGTWRKHSYPQTERHPVACVSRADTMAYLAWVSQHSEHHYRLPSEAEWEYAARAGLSNDAAIGLNPDPLCRRGNVADAALKRDVPSWTPPFAACDDRVSHGTALVGSYTPNSFGLYDMVGNLWEYTEDCYGESYVGAPSDGSAVITPECVRRTIRGGGWLNGPGLQSGNDGEHRAANRGRNSPGAHFDSMGFRVARDFP